MNDGLFGRMCGCQNIPFLSHIFKYYIALEKVKKTQRYLKNIQNESVVFKIFNVLRGKNLPKQNWFRIKNELTMIDENPHFLEFNFRGQIQI